jgi:sporulation protein YqfC
MRSITKSLHKLTSQMLDLPQDVTSDLPRVTMIGNVQLYIENHRGVQHVSSELLRLGLSQGKLEVHGKELVIRVIYPEEVYIEGIVHELKYIP